MRNFYLIFFFLGLSFSASAQKGEIFARIYYRQGSGRIDTLLDGNAEAFASFIAAMRKNYENGFPEGSFLKVYSYVSLEGTESFNARLCKRRSDSVIIYLRQHVSIPDSVVVHDMGYDWKTLTTLVKDSGMPYRKQVLDILRTPAGYIHQKTGSLADTRKRELVRLMGGIPYNYMERYFFPKMRNSFLEFSIEIKQATDTLAREESDKKRKEDSPVLSPVSDSISVLPAPEEITDTVVPTSSSPFYMALKTNLLYDTSLVPNLGVEFYLGKGWSVAANWMYAWWKSDRKHNYWRTYGGDMEIRRWFGKKTMEKPLTGHHIGFYGQIITYDFELGGRGYLGNRWSYGAGVSYGYSHPVGKQLNLDFTLGIGYLGGEYKEYIPVGNFYVWQATRQRRWFGPTKAEISLVWLIGHGNYNNREGGRR